ncbi:hypothetical protein [Allorhizocola rhizosphaerae]|uniref:hypothetical protein n=1 Tax=Allorhizocola rhizosphaerae TaxID=1872709 RepID=UPI000E3ED79F|nr:hypothetical protein [Allorhizocola rhizosphaerae]
MTATVPPAAVHQVESYPIVFHRALDPKERRGLLGLRRRSRDHSEVPRPNGHQVLVYRINGRDVADNGALKLDDEQVLEATYVSLVDVRRDAPVTVRLMLPSKDDSEFALQVAFACTVADPVTIVRDGVVRAEPILAGHLRSYAKIFELGLDYELAQLNELRRLTTAQVRAFLTVKPITVPGMKVNLAGVEVLTPEELRSLGNSLRSNAFDGRIESERMRREQERERTRVAFEQDLARLAREHEQQMEAQRRRFAQAMRRDNDLPAPDAKEALYLALENGALTPTEYQERLTELEEREFNRWQPARQDDQAWARERERMELQAQLRRLELEDQWRQQELAWERDDRLRAEQHMREDRIHELDMKLDVLREFAKRGHLDLVNVNVDKLVSDLVPTAAELGGDARPELTVDGDTAALPAGDNDADESDRDAEVRDEDVD